MRRRSFPLTLTGWLLAGALTLSLGDIALAQEHDASQPINVIADRLDLDDLAGTAVYTGDVDIRQGSLQVTGDRVEIRRNDAGEVSLITATGQRAYVEQRPSAEEELMRGWGRTILYHVAERRVELIDQAELHQARDTFDGAYVEYFLDRRVVQARSDVEGSERQRVRMTLNPEQQ